MREQVYEILKERIVNDYYPPDTRLSELDLCAELKVSRSPVREAIRQLETDGIVTGEANKGVTVRRFTEKDIRDLYQVEIMMQNSSIQCAGSITDASLQELLKDIRNRLHDSFYAGDRTAYLQASELLHDTIVQMCDNSFSVAMYRRISVLNHRFRSLSLKNEERYRKSYDEHIGIIDALLQNRLKDAQLIMMQHLQAAADVVLMQIPAREDIEQ